jgi:uncharacterized protein
MRGGRRSPKTNHAHPTSDPLRDMIHPVDPVYSICGFGVGVLVGMTGVGGGSLMTPLLIILFGVHPATAVGTDLLYAAATKGAGTLVHGIHKTIDWSVVSWLAAGSTPSTALTLLLLSHFDTNGSAAHRLITAALSIALGATAAALIFRNRILACYAARVGELGQKWTIVLTMAVGGVLGALVSISSVGAGALGATALILLYPRLSMARIVGSDIAHAAPLTLIAGLGHWVLGAINWPLLCALLAGSLPGIVLGSCIAVRVPESVLRFGLATMLIIVASRLVL